MSNEYISRESVLADIEQTIENSGCVNYEREIIDCVRYADAADVAEVVHAKWLIPGPLDLCFRCSACGASDPGDERANLTPCCPNCGAKMDGGEKRE